MDGREQEKLQKFAAQASVCRQQGDFAGALHHLHSALQVTAATDSTVRARLYANIGMVHIDMQLLDAAAACFSTASDLFAEVGNHAARAAQIGNIGSIHRDRGDFAKALRSYREALAIFEGEEYLPGIADQHANIAFALAQQGERLAAIDHFDQARTSYQQSGQPERAAMCTGNIDRLMAGNND